MKKSIHSFLATAAFGLAGLLAHAQSSPKILTVDMAKLYENDYKTQDYMGKLQADAHSAQAQYDQMTKDLTALKAQYDELVEQTRDPTATADAKAKSGADAQKKGQELQGKLTERNNFGQQVTSEFNQRRQSFHDTMMDEIGQKASEIAKSHGATLLIDKSGISVLGAKTIVYADPSYEITDEVMAAINKDRPAPVPGAPAAPAGAAPATTPAPAAAPSSLPPMTVPGVTAPTATP
jgi:outer membrane protein